MTNSESKIKMAEQILSSLDKKYNYVVTLSPMYEKCSFIRTRKLNDAQFLRALSCDILWGRTFSIYNRSGDELYYHVPEKEEYTKDEIKQIIKVIKGLEHESD